MFLVELIASSFFYLFSKQATPECRGKRVLVDISTEPFLTGQSWRVLKSLGNTGEAPEQRFRVCFADGFKQSLVLSMA